MLICFRQIYIPGFTECFSTKGIIPAFGRALRKWLRGAKLAGLRKCAWAVEQVLSLRDLPNG
jgi:hypothetical protein